MCGRAVGSVDLRGRTRATQARTEVALTETTGTGVEQLGETTVEGG